MPSRAVNTNERNGLFASGGGQPCWVSLGVSTLRCFGREKKEAYSYPQNEIRVGTLEQRLPLGYIEYRLTPCGQPPPRSQRKAPQEDIIRFNRTVIGNK